jgi:hypothetical protein
MGIFSKSKKPELMYLDWDKIHTFEDLKAVCKASWPRILVTDISMYPELESFIKDKELP